MNNHTNLPKSVQIKEDGTIIYFWHRFNIMILVFLVFDLWWIWILASGLTKDIERSVFDILGELLCASPVLILSYYVLARLLNRTEFWVRGNELFIQHRPLPWFGNRVISLSDIEGFTVEVTNAGGTYYHLFVDIRDKPRSKLFPMLSTIFIDLTNDTRENVAVALHQQLTNVVQNIHPQLIRSQNDDAGKVRQRSNSTSSQIQNAEKIIFRRATTCRAPFVSSHMM